MNKFRYHWIMLVVLTVGPGMAFAQKPPVNSLNETMTEIGATMADIFPLIVDKRQITASEEKQVHQAMQRLERLFRQAKPFIDRKSTTYHISYDLVQEHLHKTEQAFEQNNIIYARKRLYSLGNICASCHTQDTRLRTLFPGVARQKFHDDFSYAEFNYMTRNYTQAVKYYDRYLKHKGERKTELAIITPLQRLITIYTQIYNTPGVAAKLLAKYRDLPDHTKKTREHLEGWINGLKTLRASGVAQQEKLSFAELENYVQRYIGNDDQAMAEFFSTPEKEVARVWLRGRLFHYLNTRPPQEEVPQILLWLSICDRSVAYDFYFYLADLYLKQCVFGYPKSPYARQCFDEYKNFIEVSYSGSAGVFIPPEVEDELFEMESVLRKNH